MNLEGLMVSLPFTPKVGGGSVIWVDGGSEETERFVRGGRGRG